MPRLTKIYTRTGDDGTTALGTAKRVSKDSLRVHAYGEVDELNSVIGFALTCNLDSRLNRELVRIQNELFHLGAELAFPSEGGSEADVPRLKAGHVVALESTIDELNQIVGPLENFILPGGTSGAAALHIARTICRRAERSLVTLAGQETLSAHVLPYMNRLSDALFVMARYENHRRSRPERLWESHA